MLDAESFNHLDALLLAMRWQWMAGKPLAIFQKQLLGIPSCADALEKKVTDRNQNGMSDGSRT